MRGGKMKLRGKRVTLGISGGIAAYKAAELVRLMVKAGLEVRVIMTSNATKFVSPLTFQTLAQSWVRVDTFEAVAPHRVEHVTLAGETDLFVVAPATANILAKMARGIADDLLSTFYLAYEGSTLVAPAMNTRMYLHPATQENLEILRKRGVVVMDPQEGELACGETGPGRFPEPPFIMERVVDLLYEKDFHGRTFLVTAGPTREYLDAVRFISNPSTGKMGFALAQEARRRGARVYLVSGPTHLSPPWGVEYIPVATALEMYQRVMDLYSGVDVVLKAAAVADFRPKPLAENGAKFKKEGRDRLTIELEANPDILAALGAQKERQILVGFAAESQDLLENAQAKLARKNLDMIVANDVTSGFASDTNKVVIIKRDGTLHHLPTMTKAALAEVILDEVEALMRGGRTG